MKILYITNYIDIAKASGGFINDYLNDLTFHGLHELFGENVIDSTPIIHLYKETENSIDKRMYWGGFTSFHLIESKIDSRDRTNIEEKISDRYYEYIIYGNCRRSLDYYDLVYQYYPSNRIIMLDGNDDNNIDYMFANKHVYFKRELNLSIQPPFIQPISFSIPSSKITKNITPNKIKDWGTVVPGDSKTYVFSKEDEQKYYDDYNTSYFGMTHKKAGWDCMRHYEILGNFCAPYFPDIKDCPNLTMTSWNKEIQLEINDLVENKFDEKKYYELLFQMFDWLNQHNTTKNEAKKLLEKIV
jgi:hypothetical protein